MALSATDTTKQGREPSAGAAAIGASGLAKRIHGRLVLDCVDLTVAAGRVLVIAGSNGAGKTTLLRCLGGIISPTSGQIRWFGQSGPAGPAVRRQIGFVAHDSWLYGELTVRENLLFAARVYGVARPAERVDQLLEVSGLEPRAGWAVERLSRGLRQRVSIVRALVHKPPILLMDEPYASLDTAGGRWLSQLLAERRDEGVAVCLALHDLRGWELADADIVRLHEGRVVTRRSGGKTINAPAVKRGRAA